ncbi:ABC transporter ATP-binding protein [Streptosporangium sp. NBC_01469]|uniref:ABC transporter ATP-binding protein n=1 Tax=Streptosporangium sp. NBC_01469 TaxID=2903898 RepID=UPI002E2A7B8C|nr:ABC transporter ATP-binding protein [Streptosporangium sp. NBC_01469]
MTLLSIEDLSVVIHRPGRRVAALSGVNLSVEPGEVVGLVGESGGGKSMVARSIVGLPPGGSRTTGRVLFDDADVLTMGAAELESFRGHGAAICFQNPRGALSPTRTVGRQLVDRLVTHRALAPAPAREVAAELFESVGIRSPRRRLDAYPHELSGGMAQRVMISLATGCAPGLLIADEPTTGLDVTLTREILGRFRLAANAERCGVLLISHDLASIAEVCDRVVVLYAGTVVESGPGPQVLDEPAHPYTRALLRSVPDIDGRPVTATPGVMPLLAEAPSSCPFAPRCAHATELCTTELPRAGALASDWSVACFHPRSGPLTDLTGLAGPPPRPFAEPPARTALSSGAGVGSGGRTGSGAGAGSGTGTGSGAGAGSGTGTGSGERTGSGTRTGGEVLRVEDAHVVYGARFGGGGHHALRGVSLSVAAGETLGVVGESGCGKSTLARLMLGLVPPSRGKVEVAGRVLSELRGRELRRLRTRAQLVFQDPVGSLSPRRTVEDAIGEPLRAAGVPASERASRVARVLERMELDPSILGRRPHELSGGQAQRVGIARALVGDPDLIVFDEPTSALDVTVQAQILKVIAEVSGDRSRGTVLISHDLAVVRGFCDRVVVLYLGRVVEEGPVEEVFGNPLHPYTRALLAGAPSLGARYGGPRVELTKDLEEADAAAGCALAPRCPFATDECREREQELRPYDASLVACRRVAEIPALIER